MIKTCQEYGIKYRHKVGVHMGGCSRMEIVVVIVVVLWTIGYVLGGHQRPH